MKRPNHEVHRIPHPRRVRNPVTSDVGSIEVMKTNRRDRLFSIAFRLSLVIAIALLCDHWLYVHMTEKWSLLQIHNQDYWNDNAGRAWNVSDIRALFGEPDSVASNCISYMAFDFRRSTTPFPVTAILLTCSLDHFQRHDIDFFFDSNGDISAYSESENDGSLLKYKEEPQKADETDVSE